MAIQGNWRNVMLIPLAVLAFSGCGKDRTVDDYRRDKVNQELSKYQAIAGTYAGSIVSDATSEPVANVSVELKPETVIGSSPDGLSSEQRAVLTAKAQVIVSRGSTQYVFRNTYYDSETGIFRATLSVLKDGVPVVVDFAGRIQNKILEGRIETLGYPDSASTFKFVRDLDVRSLPFLRRPPGSDRDGTNTSRFFAQLSFAGDPVENMELTITENDLTSEEEVIGIFVPVRTVSTALITRFNNYYSPKSVLDTRTRQLRAVMNMERGALNLNCRGLSAEAWRCEGVGPRGLLFSGVFTNTPPPPPTPPAPRN